MKKLIWLAMLIIAVSGATASTITDINTTITNGNMDVSTSNTDSGVDFHAMGGFNGNYHSSEQGDYLDTNVLMNTDTGASFSFAGYQNLAGYTNNKVDFETFAYGTNAVMNNRFDNSMYVVQLERVDTSKDFLSASDDSNYGIGWRMNIVDRTTNYSSSGAELSLTGLGSGIFDTNQWHSTSIGNYGWGNEDRIDAPNPVGYYTPTNTVTATGSGTFTQYGYGDNSLEMNGFTFGSGDGLFTANFNGGFSGVYSVRGN